MFIIMKNDELSKEPQSGTTWLGDEPKGPAMLGDDKEEC